MRTEGFSSVYKYSPSECPDMMADFCSEIENLILKMVPDICNSPI